MPGSGGLTGASTRGQTAAGSGPGTSGRTAADAAMAEVLLTEEATRAHGFAGLIALVNLAVLVSLPWLGGYPPIKAVCGGGLLLMFLLSSYVWGVTREDTARYTVGLHRVYGWSIATAVIPVELYFGVFSPVPVVLTLGIYYLAQSYDRTHAFAIPAYVIGVYLAMAICTAFGVMPDHGLFPAHGVDLRDVLFASAAVVGVLAATTGMARVSRASLRDAIRRSNEALLMAQAREAQLAEVHHQLDRALRIAVGKPGRYTGQQAGDYVLGDVLGVGAIGEVYEAEHVRTGGAAAVKLLQQDASAREDLVERFLREGAISSKLDSPNVVRVYDVGRMADGAPYLTMERLRGRDLASRLRQEGLLSLREMIRLAEELGEGLRHAHNAGVVHRDLKPLNVFEAKEGDVTRWKILDFGISKLATSSGTLTQQGVVGTPGYMSPEQARGIDVDARSDVFAMGVVLYRAMTGRPAFPGDNTPQIMFDIVYKTPPRPSLVAKGLPSDVDLVMALALAKDPEHRIESAAALARAFKHACRRKLDAELRTRGHAAIRSYPWGRALAPGMRPGQESDQS